MTERDPRMSEFDVPSLREGYSAVMLPPIGEAAANVKGHIIDPTTPEKGLAQLNNFLAGLHQQGAEIVTTMSVPFNVIGEKQAQKPEAYSGGQKAVEPRTVFIVKKGPGK